MRFSFGVALPLIVVALGACGRRSVPDRIAASFVRQDALVPGLVTRLHVTPTGMTVVSPSVSASASGSLGFGGKPLLSGSTRTELGFSAQGAALFASVTCSDDACTFTTKNGCEGSLTADAGGDVVLIATGECGPWSGKWLRERDAPPQTSAAPESACPPPPACPPCPAATPGPMGSASAGRSFGRPTDIHCLTECNHTQMTCVQECKIGDTACIQECSSTVMTCTQRCR